MNSNYYILNGHEVVPASLLTWSSWYEKADRIVAQTKVGNETISTVFLGLNYQYGDGPPLIFETMVFNGTMDNDQWRYSTWEEAEEGHAMVVKQVLRL